MVDVAAGRGFLSGLESGQRMYTRQQDAEWAKKRRARREKEWDYQDEQRADQRAWKEERRGRQRDTWEQQDEERARKDKLRFYRAVRHLQSGNPTLLKDPEHLESLENLALGGRKEGTELIGVSPTPDGESIALDLQVTPKDGADPYVSYVTQNRLMPDEEGYSEDKPALVPMGSLFSSAFRVGEDLRQEGAGPLLAAIDEEAAKAGDQFLADEDQGSTLSQEAAGMGRNELDSRILALGGNLPKEKERYTTYRDDAGNLMQRSATTGETSVILEAPDRNRDRFAPTEIEKMTDFYMRENGGKPGYGRDDARSEAKSFIVMENYPKELEQAREILVEQNESRFTDKWSPEEIERMAYAMADRAMTQMGVSQSDLDRYRGERGGAGGSDGSVGGGDRGQGRSGQRGAERGSAGGSSDQYDLSDNAMFVYREALRTIAASGKPYSELNAAQRRAVRESVGGKLSKGETSKVMQMLSRVE